MSKEERAHQQRKGLDLWSGRHPIESRRASWWKRLTARTWRRIMKRRTDKQISEEA